MATIPTSFKFNIIVDKAHIHTELGPAEIVVGLDTKPNEPVVVALVLSSEDTQRIAYHAILEDAESDKLVRITFRINGTDLELPTPKNFIDEVFTNGTPSHQDIVSTYTITNLALPPDAQIDGSEIDFQETRDVISPAPRAGHVEGSFSTSSSYIELPSAGLREKSSGDAPIAGDEPVLVETAYEDESPAGESEYDVISGAASDKRVDSPLQQDQEAASAKDGPAQNDTAPATSAAKEAVPAVCGPEDSAELTTEKASVVVEKSAAAEEPTAQEPSQVEPATVVNETTTDDKRLNEDASQTADSAPAVEESTVIESAVVAEITAEV
ncbi:hypothetical protein FBU59_003989, partial [Linderina macrospora]